MQYCSYQITIFANLPPPSKCRLVLPAPLHPPRYASGERCKLPQWGLGWRRALWYGLSANLGCRSETGCMWLAENTGRKKPPTVRHLDTITQLCRAISSQLRHVSTIRKKLVKQPYLPTFLQYGEHRPTSGWDRFVSLGTPANFTVFRVLAALLHGIVVVGVSQTCSVFQQGGHPVGHWPTF